jgi:GT2 family glycosyltransferase
MLISASVVTYKASFESISDLIDSLVESKLNRVYIFDNSPENLLGRYFRHPKIVYRHIPSNPGFGSAHNMGFRDAIESGIDYHFVINPDIHLVPCVIDQMVQNMEKDTSIGMMMPRIEFPDGTIQHLPKLLPSPLSILRRKLKSPVRLHKAFVNMYELRFVDEHMTYSSPTLSGCFTLFRISAVKEVGYYDERYFMYFEDWDLARRMHDKFKTIYSPEVKVIHEYYSGANKSIKLFFHFIRSMIIYFNKWGWFVDRKRKYINLMTLKQFEK